MKVCWILGFLFFLSCNRDSSSGIIPQTQLTSQKFDRINTYYIYDYVSKDQLIEYSLKQEHKSGRKSIHYYFSHNANIPSHELKYLESNFKNTSHYIISNNLSLDAALTKTDVKVFTELDHFIKVISK